MEFLRDAGIFADVWEANGRVFVEIEWGDWKHEHARAKWLMQENGYRHLGTVVTEEDGSDCYSAVHQFEKGARDDVYLQGMERI